MSGSSSLGPVESDRDPEVARLDIPADGGSCIALTLLAIELRLPKDVRHHDRRELGGSVLSVQDWWEAQQHAPQDDSGSAAACNDRDRAVLEQPVRELVRWSSGQLGVAVHERPTPEPPFATKCTRLGERRVGAMDGEKRGGLSTEAILARLHDGASVTTIEGEIEVLEGLDSALPPDDGVRWFNLLYLLVTREVHEGPPSGVWADAR